MRCQRLLCLLLLLPYALMVQARPLVIGVTSWVGTAPINVADAKGYWREQGLDVRIVKFEEYKALFAAYQARKIDLMYDMTGTWVDLYQQGVPLIILGEMDWSNGGDKLIAKNSLTDMQKLKGQTIGVYLNRTPVLLLLDRYLRQYRLQLGDVKVVELEAEPLTQAFIHNKFPMILHYDPPALDARRKGDGRVVADSSQFPGIIPEGVVIHPESLRALPEGELVKFFVGWIRAVQWIKGGSSWQEFQAILNQRTFAGEKPYASFDLLGMLNAVRFHSRSEMQRRNEEGGGMQGYLDEVRQFLLQNKRLKRDFDSSTLVDTSALLQAIRLTTEGG
ncbi:ABC transporter substrate-binding protein [Leeia sp.]|uniref:ABC transporter substrate-binding protein n=1 Tax=Leeia sp. TaxID=2884678 RepID=UPI0035AFEF09